MEDNIKIPRKTFQVIMLESFRYCLGRQSYAVSECVDNLMWYWNELPAHYRYLIKQEIKFAIHANSAGDTQDIAQWHRILELK